MGPQFVWAFCAVTVHVVRRSEGHEVGVHQCGPVEVTIEFLLVHSLHVSKCIVAEHHTDQRDVVRHHGCHFRHAVPETTVAGHRHYRSVGVTHSCTDCGGIAIPKRALITGVDVATRMMDRECITSHVADLGQLIDEAGVVGHGVAQRRNVGPLWIDPFEASLRPLSDLVEVVGPTWLISTCLGHDQLGECSNTGSGITNNGVGEVAWGAECCFVDVE